MFGLLLCYFNVLCFNTAIRVLHTHIHYNIDTYNTVFLSSFYYQQDDEIVMDICACLITLLQDHPDLSSLILELGFVSKLRENLEASHATPAVYELSLLVLCAILRGNSILHRTVVLKLGSRHHINHSNSHSNSHINSGTSSGSSAFAQASANSIFTTTNIAGFGVGMDTSTSYGGGFFNHATPVEEVSFQKPTSYQPGKLFC